MSDNPNSYNFPYRTNFEARIFAIWMVAGLVCFLSPYLFDVPHRVYWAFALGCVLIGLVLGRGGFDIYIKKSKLKGYRLEFIDPNSNRALKMFGINDKEVIKNVKANRR